MNGGGDRTAMLALAENLMRKNPVRLYGSGRQPELYHNDLDEKARRFLAGEAPVWRAGRKKVGAE